MPYFCSSCGGCTGGIVFDFFQLGHVAEGAELCKF